MKRNQFLVLFWVILFGFIHFFIGQRYGIPLLFLDPEYLGHVSFLSFFLLGFAFGAYLMVWNVTSYILHAHHFPFLATLQRPFGVYCLNNSLIPMAFLLDYLIMLCLFQRNEGLQDWTLILFRIAGLISGVVFFTGISMAYFFGTNKNIFQLLGLKGKEIPQEFDHQGPTWEESKPRHTIHVQNYLNQNLSLKLTRPIDHYPAAIILQVYRQHHLNALFIELSSFLLLVVLGHLIDFPFFRIPAGSSILLLIAITVMLLGAVFFWLKSWKVFVSIMGLLLLDFLISLNLLQYKNRAYGLDHHLEKPIYSLESIKAMNSLEHMRADEQQTLEVLENWRAKFPADAKPTLVFINCSGGGLRASMFSMNVLQVADSITGGKLMDHSILMTGASGGMIAAAYYRELYRQRSEGLDIDPNDMKYLDNISSDLLNAISFTLVVNDLFFPWQSFSYNDIQYRKDRGYIFEKNLHENTDSVLLKPVSFYKTAEHNAQIPLMLFYPTIINDERKLFIGAHRYSYMGVPSQRYMDYSKPEMDGVDIHYLLGDEQSDRLLLSSAIRMSGTFPYILPNVHLPTEPEIELMDAGIRDNYGIESTVRFIDVFQDWITENTGGVVVLNIRGQEQEMPIRKNISQGVTEKIFSPIGNLYLNWVEVQDYQNDFLLHYAHDILSAPLDVVTIDYKPAPGSKRASLSLHLTTREKMDVRMSVHNSENYKAFLFLDELIR
jgi:hypothetical protein